MTSPPRPAVPPPYSPAPFLMAGPSSFLTREQLILYFEDFYASLEYANTAPHLVFERLIGNLSVPVHAAIHKAWLARTSEDSREDILPADVPVPAVETPVHEEEEVRPSQQHLIYSFHTQDGVWDGSTRAYCTLAFPTANRPDTSRIALALTSLHLSKDARPIASARITAPDPIGLSATLGTLSDGFQSELQSASCSWLELNPSDVDMQCGVWSLSEAHEWRFPQMSTTHNITFRRVYDQPPQVLVWLKHIFLERGYDRSLQLVVSSITSAGFTLDVNSLLENSLYSAEITWLACSTSRPDVHIGMIEEDDGVQKGTGREGYVAFETTKFTAAPRTIIGITGFDVAKKHDLRIAVEVVEVTSKGLKWRIDGTAVASARGSFIALY